MSDAYQELAKRENSIAESLGETAHAVGMGALSNSLLAVSKSLVKRLLKDNGLGVVSEPASDLRALRLDYSLMQAKEQDLKKAEIVFNNQLIKAMKDGYEYDAKERSKIVMSESTGLVIHVDLTEQELSDLNSFPIHGLTAKEWSAKARYTLSMAIDQALAQPLTGAVDIAALPGLLSNCVMTHANSLQSLVKEAFFAGTKAAMLAIRDALAA